MVVSNSLSAARHCQRPLSFVGSHLSGTFVQRNSFFRDVHLGEIGCQPTNDFQIRRVVTIRLNSINKSCLVIMRTTKRIGRSRNVNYIGIVLKSLLPVS